MGRKQTWARKHIHVFVASLILLSLSGCATPPEIRDREEARTYLYRGQELLARGDYEGALGENQKVLSLSGLKPPGDEALFNLGLIYAHFGYPQKDYDKSINYFVGILNEYPKSPLGEQAKIWIGVLQDCQRLNLALEKSKRTVEETKQMVEKLEKPKKVEPPPVEERGEPRETLLRSQRLLAQGDFEGALTESQKVLTQSPRRPPEDEALFTIALIYAHAGNPKKDYGKSIDAFKRLIKDHPRSPLAEQAKVWVTLLQENEKLNEVIEKSKKVDIEIEQKKREIKK